MANSWQVVGQVGNIIKKDECYLVNIADNIYKPNKDNRKEWKKDGVIWFNCVCDFEPRVKTGDTVMAQGEFLPSNSEKYPQVLKINHIGVIKKKDMKDI